MKGIEEIGHWLMVSEVGRERRRKAREGSLVRWVCGVWRCEFIRRNYILRGSILSMTGGFCRLASTCN